jgi:hypothetical protein
VTYPRFRDSIAATLARHPAGLTWREVNAKSRLALDRPCPEWTRRLEHEIGLVRRPGQTRALVWQISAPDRVARTTCRPHDRRVAKATH